MRWKFEKTISNWRKLKTKNDLNQKTEEKIQIFIHFHVQFSSSSSPLEKISIFFFPFGWFDLLDYSFCFFFRHFEWCISNDDFFLMNNYKTFTAMWMENFIYLRSLFFYVSFFCFPFQLRYNEISVRLINHAYQAINLLNLQRMKKNHNEPKITRLTKRIILILFEENFIYKTTTLQTNASLFPFFFYRFSIDTDRIYFGKQREKSSRKKSRNTRTFGIICR